jgi:hypothetical protein
MPIRPLTRRPPRLRYPVQEQRPNAAARGYCDRRHRAWRAAVLVRDDWTCRDCGRVCGAGREAHADHVSPVVAGSDMCRDGRSRYDIAGGQCLCVACHARKTKAESRESRAALWRGGGEGQSCRCSSPKPTAPNQARGRTFW